MITLSELAASVTRVPLDTTWAVEQLQSFVAVAKPYRSYTAGAELIADYSQQGNDTISARAAVTEQILDRVTPSWRTSVPASAYGRWRQHREAAGRAVTHLQYAEELRDKLGEDAPMLSAGSLHPWAWQGAQSMWSVGSYDRAVEDALARVNAETRNKVDRRDLGEAKLFQLVFSTDAPKPGVPRLRLMEDDGSDTFRSVHRGAAALAEGLFALLRNPTAHEVRAHEGDQQVALERLAAVSTLARTVDQTQVAQA